MRARLPAPEALPARTTRVHPRAAPEHVRTAVHIEERDGRIYARISGPSRCALVAGLLEAFGGHRRLYYSRAHDHFRLWARDRERLAVFLESTCERSWITWQERESTA